jgi:hypothetical protein
MPASARGLTSEERNELRRLRREMGVLLGARDPKGPGAFSYGERAG